MDQAKGKNFGHVQMSQGVASSLLGLKAQNYRITFQWWRIERNPDRQDGRDIQGSDSMRANQSEGRKVENKLTLFSFYVYGWKNIKSI